MFQIVFNQILIMLMLMAVGFISSKTRLIGDGGKSTLSNLLMMVINPALVFISFQIERTPEVLHNLFLTMLIAGIVMGLMIVLFTFLFRKKKDDTGRMELFFCIYSNCGFIGIPLVNSMLGSEGVICLAGFVAVFNVIVWTHGLVTMSGSYNRTILLKGILSPTMFAIAAGIIFFLLDIKVPDLIYQAADYVSSMNTPVAMLIAGASLAGAELRSTFKNARIYLVTFLKLIVYPLIAMLILYFIPLDKNIAYSVLVASACPSATTGVAFALKFKKDYAYASQLFVVTTLISMATIPLMVLLAETIGIG